jgi:hypothetical protein
VRLNRKYVVVAAVIVLASFLFGTMAAAAPSGRPFEDIWNAIFGIQDDVESLEAQVDELEASILVGLPEPDFDSGWVNAECGTEDIILTHNLGTRDLFVYIYYRMNDPTIPSPDYTATHNIRAHEVYWFAYDYNAIKIGFTHPDYVWQEIRVLIWAIPD